MVSGRLLFLVLLLARETTAFEQGDRLGSGAIVARAQVYSLERCLRLAEQHYPKVHQAQAKLHHQLAELREARTAPFSDFTLRGGVGPAPTVFGTSVYSPNTDISLSSNMALAWQIGIEGAIPLWTFGKLESLWSAAEAQTRVGEQAVKQSKNEVKLSVRKAFWGAQLARDALTLIREAIRRIEKYADRLASKVESGDADEVQLLKLRMNAAELEARESQARRQLAIALAGLRFLTGVKGALDVPNVPLVRTNHTLGPLARYLAAARLFRPEINMARAGVAARRAQVSLERARLFPDLAVGLSANWARAEEVADQRNPFVQDNANYFHYGAALVLRWKLDFLPQSARLAKAEADLEEMRATERFALGGVGVEVEEAFEEAEDAARRLDAYARATGYARRWVIEVQHGIDVGTYDDEDIVDPAKEYALKRFELMNATFDYNLSIAKLALATGWDSVAPVD